MRAFISLATAAVLTLPSSLAAMASDHITACVQKKGHGLLSAAYWTYRADEFWNADGKRRDGLNTFKKWEYYVRGEYGVTCRDTVTFTGGWAKIDESVNGTQFGFEDVEVGWKRHLGWKWSHYVTAEVVGIIPVETEFEPGLRYGRYGGEVNLLLSRGFKLWEKKGRYDLRAGYRAYEGFPSDQVRADAVYHLFPLSCFKVSVGGHLEYGLFNGGSKIDASHFLLNPNYRLFRGTIEGEWNIFRCVSIYAGYHRHLWGRNVGTNGGVYGGVQAQF